MIPLAIPQMTGSELTYLKECIDSNFVSSVGPFVNRFEEIVAHEAGARSAVATSSGSTGLHVALVAVGVDADFLAAVLCIRAVVDHAGCIVGVCAASAAGEGGGAGIA